MRKAVQGPLQGLVGIGLIALAVVVAGCGGGGGDADVGTAVRVTTMMQGAPTDATLVAFQDGAGPWQVLTVTRAGGYTGTVKSPDGKFGIAVVQGAPAPLISVFYGTTAEITDVPFNRAESRVASGWTVSGTMAGIGGGEGSVFVPENSASRGADGPYNVAVWPGANDLLAVHSVPGGAIDKYLIRREANISSNLTWDVDFAGPSALVPTDFNVACPGTPTATVGWSLRTKCGATVGRGGTGSVTGKALPLAVRDAGDVYVLGSSKMTPAAFDATTIGAQVTTTNPVDTDLTLPSAVTASISSPSTTPYARLRGDWTWAGTLTGVMVDGSSVAGEWHLIASAGWLGSATSLTAPDLSGIAGWQTAWHPTEFLAGGVTVVQCSGGMAPVANYFVSRPLPAGLSLQNSARRYW